MRQCLITYASISFRSPVIPYRASVNGMASVFLMYLGVRRSRPSGPRRQPGRAGSEGRVLLRGGTLASFSLVGLTKVPIVLPSFV